MDKVVSVLIFPYANRIEVRVTRAKSFADKPSKINVYSVLYSDKKRAYRLADLASRMNGLVTKKMIDIRVMVASPLQ